MRSAVPLPKNLNEFRDSRYWDEFFKARGGRPFEWYGEWKHISKLVTAQCGLKKRSKEKVLIPGCGNSTLSADMYDDGFTDITNIDFSRVVISEMLREHVRLRQGMRWLLMDMTKMQLPGDSFDIVVDKGGLDALLGEPENDRSPGAMFLSEVQRVLKPNGRFACVTLAQQQVLELLLATFRDGWYSSVHGLQLSAADAPSSLQPFLVIAKRDSRPILSLVSFDLDLDWRGLSNKFQVGRRESAPDEYVTLMMQSVVEAVDAENKLRNEGLEDSRMTEGHDVNPEDTYENLYPGRRLTVKLGSQTSQFTYTGVILDAKEDIKLEYRCAVFLVPKGRAREWLFSSIEGQWQVAESTKAGRLILVILDPNQYVDSILNVKDDLSPLVKCFLPLDCRESGNVPYMTQGDDIASRTILDEVHSPMTGAMLVEDVVLLGGRSIRAKPAAVKRDCFRRLVFRRNPNLIQSEALLTRGSEVSKNDEKGRSVGEPSRKHGANKKKKKVNKEVLPTSKSATCEELKVDHSYLASPYHEAMIASFVLIANNFEQWLVSKEEIRLMLVGLGAGLLPMFIHNHLPINDIEIVELDPVVGDVAKRHFGFIEDDRMKLKIGDGIVAVQTIAATTCPTLACLPDNLPEVAPNVQQEGSCEVPGGLMKSLTKLEVKDGDGGTLSIGTDLRLHVLIIDADSEDPSSGLSCPPPEFLEDTFLQAAKTALADGGMLIINVVSRATHHVGYITQLKKFFEEVYDIDVHDDDVNRVLIALPQPRNGGEPTDIMEDLTKFEKIMTQFAPRESRPKLSEIVQDLKRFK